MALNFPTGPSLNQTYTSGNKTWVWNGSGWALATTLANLTVSGNTTVGNLSTAGRITSTIATGTAPFTITSTTKVANLNVEQVDGFDAAQISTVSTIVVRDASGYANVAGILNGGANGTGNIGSSTTTFNTIFAKATSAQYADLAEMYEADGYYPPAHVVVFGGDKEITLSTKSHDTRVAGVISTNPSYLMNSAHPGEFVLPVALTGRVPCLVQGPVAKGDVLVTGSAPGTAQRIGVNWQPGCVIGKALESITTNEVTTIEVVVGRF